MGTRQLVDVGGRRLNARRAGRSEPELLLVHGIPTNHLLWHDVVPALAQDARVLAVDVLGYGWSDAPGDWPVDIASRAGHLPRLRVPVEVVRGCRDSQVRPRYGERLVAAAPATG
ncbi:alpha/beta fold hydrolase [Quadrisphaera sp. DSM 44207]|uniref:alpha/beta fold hydrolase n=1 Tax=Quadrisphaera sp. DSM 44207 TaxID=1881057 RepID=UPI0015A3FA44|nr:alpha/beta fold hydrolase [Quadrisphaera sp. DSM 44207]